MQTARGSRGWWLALLLLSATGCREAMLYDLSWGWPFGKDKEDPAELARYGVMPLQRIKELDTMANQIQKAAPEERERLTQELARRMQNEIDPLVRVKMMTMIAEQKSPTTVAVLEAGLRDPDESVRRACCRGWAKQEPKAAAAMLERVIRSDQNMDVRQTAARSLGKIKDPAAITALSAALDDNEISVQSCAMESLKEVSGKDFGLDVRLWREFARGGNPTPPSISVADRFKSLF